jgi:hypothetical protein
VGAYADDQFDFINAGDPRMRNGNAHGQKGAGGIFPVHDGLEELFLIGQSGKISQMIHQFFIDVLLGNSFKRNYDLPGGDIVSYLHNKVSRLLTPLEADVKQSVSILMINNS